MLPMILRSTGAVSPRAAVSVAGFVRNLPGLALAAACILAISAASCSRQSADAAPDPASLLQKIALPDPAKLPGLEASKHWENPYLVIRPDQVGMLTGVDAVEEHRLKPEEVLPALAQLPPAAWPYGRTVAVLVDAKAASSEQEKVDLRRNRGIVGGELQSAHVVIHWIPSPEGPAS